MARPFVTPDDHHEDCQCDSCIDPLRFWRGVFNALILTVAIGVAIALAIFAFQATAGAAEPKPIPAPDALLRARKACPNTASAVRCRTALRHAYQGLEWAKRERSHRWEPTVEYAIQIACTSQPTLDCNWFRRMIGCESGRDPFNKNPTSTASGLAQFLDTTWSGNRFSRFSVFDPIANALGAAWYATRAGHAPWYASKGCWS